MANFRCVTDPADGEFYVVMPDDTELDDFTAADDIAMFEYGGKAYMCAGADFALVREGRMIAGTVYGVGTCYQTVQEEFEDTDTDTTDTEGGEDVQEAETEETAAELDDLEDVEDDDLDLDDELGGDEDDEENEDDVDDTDD